MLRKPIVWICKRRLDFRHDAIDTHGIYEEPYDDEDDGRMHVIRYKGATKTADNDVGDYTDWQQHRRSTNIHACERRHGRTTTQKQNGNDHQRCEKRVELFKKLVIILETFRIRFWHTVNMICADMPNRALTISKNVRAPFAFSFTLEAITVKKMICTL